MNRLCNRFNAVRYKRLDIKKARVNVRGLYFKAVI